MGNHIDPGLARYRWYRPRDRDGTPAHVISALRARLKAADDKLDVWWNADWKADDARQPGRWAIVYWMQRASKWAIVYYWEAAGGAYRQLEIDCAEPILNYLATIDSERGADPHTVNRKADEIVAENKRKAQVERIEAARERMDEGRLIFGEKAIYGRGRHRSRKSRLG